MEWWQAGLLGLLQGLTEFLPVSSSGHLVLAQEALGLDTQDDLVLEIFLHLGTALSIVTLYAKRVRGITWQTLQAVRRPVSAYRESGEVKMGVFILLSMVPTGLIYLFLSDRISAAFHSPRLVCAMLMVTGVLLLLSVVRKNTSAPLSPMRALVVGLAQGAAFLPGISRSGATICSALYMKVRPQDAADFAFLMSVPVIFGAAIVKGLALASTPSDTALLPLAFAALVAYLSGMVAIKVVLGFVRRGRLHYFAYYCFTIAAVGLLLT